MATDNKRMFTVVNRSASKVVYKIPEMNIRREFAPGEVKIIGFDELMQLSYQPGGREMMIQYLQITEDKALQAVGIKAQPEYYMTEGQIVDLLKSGSLEAFLDCLDFAPAGVIDLVKRWAIKLPLNDYGKRKALKDKTGYDVDAALKQLEEIKADEKALANPEAAAAQPAEQPAPQAPQGRRTNTNYKIVENK